MKAPEMTQELKGDLQVLKMRGSLDPKRFYKKDDRDGFSKYFQVSDTSLLLLNYLSVYHYSSSNSDLLDFTVLFSMKLYI